MKVIKSIETTDAILTASNISEDEYPVWVSGTSYTAKTKVIYNHKIYEAILTHTNTVNPQSDQLNWLSLGATNKYRMFDNILSNESERLGGIQFTLTPKQAVTGILLLNVNAVNARVVMTDPVGGVVYDVTKSITDVDNIFDYYDYFFVKSADNVSSKTSISFLDMPLYPSATITVYINSGSSMASVGEVVYGRTKVVGRTNYGTAIGIKSYSRKETDEFGNIVVIKRKNSKYADYDIDIDNQNLADVQRYFSDIDSIPCAFIGSGDLEELIVYGFYSDFKATISFPTVSKCTLRVEGLI